MKKSLIISIFISTLLSGLIFGGGIFLWQNAKLEELRIELEGQINNLQNVDEDNDLEEIEIQDQEAEWVKYSSKKIEYSIEYPKVWIFNESYESNLELVSFTIWNDDYSLSYNPPSSFTSICVYPDTDIENLKAELDEDFPGYYEQSAVFFEDFVEFGEYRRSSFNNKVYICKDNMKTGFEYSFPTDYESEILGLMDKMVESFVWKGTVLE